MLQGPEIDPDRDDRGTVGTRRGDTTNFRRPVLDFIEADRNEKELSVQNIFEIDKLYERPQPTKLKELDNFRQA